MSSVVQNNTYYKTAKGWLKDEERELLFELASQVKPDGTILNVGIEFGASLACLCAGSRGAKVLGIDPDCSKVENGGYCAVLNQADSHDIVKTWDKPLDLIFVDGDHGKTGVLLDAKFADFLPVGGHILFQDCWDWDNPAIAHQLVPGVNEAVTEWYDSHISEFTELASVGTTRVFKRVKEREQQRLSNGSDLNTNVQPGRTVKRKSR